MEKVYDPLEFGDGISDGPLVGIRYLIKDGADFGVSGSAMLEFFFYPNEHVHTYKYMLLSDASVFGSQVRRHGKRNCLAEVRMTVIIPEQMPTGNTILLN